MSQRATRTARGMRVVERPHTPTAWWESQDHLHRARLGECLALACLLLTMVALMLLVVG